MTRLLESRAIVGQQNCASVIFNLGNEACSDKPTDPSDDQFKKEEEGENPYK